jgi:Domain of unknown function (DUF4338)
MLNIPFKQNSRLHRFLSDQTTDLSVVSQTPEEKVRLLIVRDLLRLGWEMEFKINKVTIKPPVFYDKQIVKDAMQVKRQELLVKHSAWIKKRSDFPCNHLTDGSMAWQSSIKPIVEVCESQEQLDIFRFFRFYWSSPYSEYVGRRIKLLIRDGGLPGKPLIGLAALGSSIVHIPERDNWVGWDKTARSKNLVYSMDAYVLGALPPYNNLLGGKLISYILASNEVRLIFERKYKGKITNISQRKANRLACIFTTSLYGKSSQYNRIKYNNKLLYIPIGKTKGYGTLHLTEETFSAMRDLLVNRDISVTNRFGDGPIWRMRVIRTAAEILGFNSDFLLKHSFQREIYAVPLASNCKAFLQGKSKNLNYFNLPSEDLVSFWKKRWLTGRRTNKDVKRAVLSFKAASFKIL